MEDCKHKDEDMELVDSIGWNQRNFFLQILTHAKFNPNLVRPALEQLMID